MTIESMFRKGWCPGVLRPMRAKDGLLVRLKISCAVLPAAALRAIAQAGREHGNGLFDLTARANLQIRGLREERLPHFIAALRGLGLAGTSAAAEAVRNVLVSPLAGLGGDQNAHAAARKLEAALAANNDLHALPPKFGFVIDDGSALSLANVPAAVRFDFQGGMQPYAIGIAGRADNAISLGRCGEDDIPDIAARISRAFLTLSVKLPEPPRGMAELIESCGADAIAALCGLRLAPALRHGAIEEPCPIGLLRCRAKSHFGAGAAFGRLDAEMLDAAARGAGCFGNGEIRLTPWRTIILPLVQECQANAVGDYFTAHGFIVDRGDPRLAVAACGGSSACEHGTTDTRSDALALMSLARMLGTPGTALQVFGCPKGCGRQAGVPLTLTARDGRYDLTMDEAMRSRGKSGEARLTAAAARGRLEAIALGLERGIKLVCP